MGEKIHKYYVYLHVNPVAQNVFYVGMGHGGRAVSHHNRSKEWSKIANIDNFDVFIIERKLSKSVGDEREKFWINKIGRKDLLLGTLVNATDGGQGNNNFSPLVRKSISDKAKLRPSPNKGKAMSDEEKIKISETLKRKCRSGEWTPNVSGLHTEASKKKISESKKGKPTWNKGLKNIYSDEVKNRIRDGVKKYYADKQKPNKENLYESNNNKKQKLGR